MGGIESRMQTSRQRKLLSKAWLSNTVALQLYPHSAVWLLAITYGAKHHHVSGSRCPLSGVVPLLSAVMQVSRLHHLASTACTPGIFSPPATAAGVMRESTAVAVAGKPLEHHLKTASKQQVTRCRAASFLCAYVCVCASARPTATNTADCNLGCLVEVSSLSVSHVEEGMVCLCSWTWHVCNS